MSTVAWHDVMEGDVLRGKDGQPWTVTTAGTSLTMERDGREPFTMPRPSAGTVEVLERGQFSEDTAIALVGLQLGGAVVAHQREADGPWYVQATGWSTPDLLAHLDVFHDHRPASAMTTTELEKLHLKLHDAGPVPNPHIHDDTPYRRGGKVPWA